MNGLRKLLLSVLNSHVLSLFLLIILVLLLFLALFNIKPQKDKTGDIASSIVESSLYAAAIKDFLPENFAVQTPSILVNQSPEQSTPTPSATVATKSSKSTSKSKRSQKFSLGPKPSVTPTPLEIDIIPVSTVEGRDKDRELIFRYLRDAIEEYQFTYDKLPELYSDKSGNLLSEQATEVIYLYNNLENNTNAAAIKLGEESYVFMRVKTCNDFIPQNHTFALVYSIDSKQIEACLESGSRLVYEF